MRNETQLDRYKSLLTYIDTRFKEDINIQKVEEVCHYSYRNINRIFQALHHETIGRYIKRIRLEKAAEYLKYSKFKVSDIAYRVGFSDVAAFSKAFKNRFNCSPKAFRERQDARAAHHRQAFTYEKPVDPLPYEIKILPEMEILFLEFRGAYDNLQAIEQSWEEMIEYADQKGLLSEQTVYLAEILDDNEISDELNCRYHVAIAPGRQLEFKPSGLFRTKKTKQHKYAKFIHQGKHGASLDTYSKIYASWLTDVNLELADLPILEFYLNDESNTPAEELITEIYIPVQ